LITVIIFKRAACSARHLVTVVATTVFEVTDLLSFDALEILACKLGNGAGGVGWTCVRAEWRGGWFP
jgi:hypothetical protein